MSKIQKSSGVSFLQFTLVAFGGLKYSIVKKLY